MIIIAILVILGLILYAYLIFGDETIEEKVRKNPSDIPNTIVIRREPKPIEKFDIKEFSSFTMYNRDTGEVVLHIENK